MISALKIAKNILLGLRPRTSNFSLKKLNPQTGPHSQNLSFDQHNHYSLYLRYFIDSDSRYVLDYTATLTKSGLNEQIHDELWLIRLFFKKWNIQFIIKKFFRNHHLFTYTSKELSKKIPKELKAMQDPHFQEWKLSETAIP